MKTEVYQSYCSIMRKKLFDKLQILLTRKSFFVWKEFYRCLEIRTRVSFWINHETVAFLGSSAFQSPIRSLKIIGWPIFTEGRIWPFISHLPETFDLPGWWCTIILWICGNGQLRHGNPGTNCLLLWATSFILCFVASLSLLCCSDLCNELLFQKAAALFCPCRWLLLPLWFSLIPSVLWITTNNTKMAKIINDTFMLTTLFFPWR